MPGIERLIELYPKSMVGYIFRAGAKVAKQRWDEAVADIDKALALKAGEEDLGVLSECFAIRGSAKAGMGEVDAGLKDLDRAIEIAPKRASYYLERGKVRRDKGDVAGAISDFERALELNPKDEEARRLRDAVKQKAPAR